MKQYMEDMFADVEKPSKQDESDDKTAIEGFADQIKAHCAGSGEDLNHVMNQISGLVTGKDNESAQDAMNESKGDTEEGSEADDKAPKKAMIVAMLKRKNNSEE